MPDAAKLVGAKLVRWYRREGRDLPWRRSPDPYRVWVSEIMLQQTTVTTVGPYFERFVARYPTVRALAAADEQDVLALWSGLGYYHRARNLLKAARLMVERHRGRVPADVRSLRALPGVGAYTAGAILSIGHNLPFAALDGNIMRVVARLGGIQDEPSRASTRRAVEQRVLRLMPADRASAFNQALMDLGASICSPRRPSCGVCPVRLSCRARREGTVGAIPPARAAHPPVQIELAALAVRRNDSFLLVQRGERSPLHGMMKGLWEFPLVAASTPGDVEREGRRLGARISGCAGRVRHTITRHRLVISVYHARQAQQARPARPRRRGLEGAVAVSDAPGGRWVTLDEMTGPGAGRLPLTGAARKISRLLAVAP